VEDPSLLIPLILAGLTQLFGSAPGGPVQAAKNAQGGNLVAGGAQVFTVPDITPTEDFYVNVPMLPGFHPGQTSQIYLPVPDVNAQYGAGTTLHVTFNTTVNAAGEVTGVTDVTAHFDITDPSKGHGIGILGHVLNDLILAPIASQRQGGCAVKFQ
jgi:hypothetical protein